MENALPGIIAELKTVPETLAPDVEGWTAPKVRKLLNRLVAKLPAGESYLEIGCFQGASLISALLDYLQARAIACDNWSEQPEHRPEEKFWANLKKYEARIPKVAVYKQDCFTLPERKPFDCPVGVYFYDGNHNFESQLKAITMFTPFLAKRCVVLVDDWNWDRVRDGTWQGIDEIRPNHVSYWELPSKGNGDFENYWNGIGAFYMELR